MPKVRKLYHSIKEASKLVGVEQYVLRYWESEFPQLKPKRTKGRTRAYTSKDIKLLLLIKRLLYEDGYTIEGARKKLRSIKPTTQVEIDFEGLRAKNLLMEVKGDLEGIMKLLEGNKGSGEQ